MRMWLLHLQFGLMRILGIRRLSQDLNSRSDAAFVGVGVHFDTLRADLLEREAAMDLRLTHLERALTAVQTDLSALRDEEGSRARSATERGDTLDVNVRSIERCLAGVGVISAKVQADVSALRDEEGGRARSITERGDTLDVTMRDLRGAVAELASASQGDAFGRDSAEFFETSLADLRVEVLSLRTDLAREIEIVTDEVITASRSLTQAIAQIAGELRVELSCLRGDIAGGMEASSERTRTMVDRLRAAG